MKDCFCRACMSCSEIPNNCETETLKITIKLMAKYISNNQYMRGKTDLGEEFYIPDAKYCKYEPYVAKEKVVSEEIKAETGCIHLSCMGCSINGYTPCEKNYNCKHKFLLASRQEVEELKETIIPKLMEKTTEKASEIATEYLFKTTVEPLMQQLSDITAERDIAWEALEEISVADEVQEAINIAQQTLQKIGEK